MTNSGAIPFLDLVSPHKELREELVEVFNTALDSAAFIGGPAVEKFESEFAQFSGAKYCIGVGSGTDALRFAFIAAGIGPGDAIVTVPNTFIATSEAISQAGAVPVFVDVDEQTCNMDASQLQKYIEEQCDWDAAERRLVDRRTGTRVVAVVPVHLYGQMADLDAIQEVVEPYGITIFEDACQAHGAEYYSRREERWITAGSFGKAAAFSFYPGKNLGACGEGGAVTTNDEDLARRVRMLRDHGQSRKYYHAMEGYNGRLDAIQAGILRAKLKRLPDWTQGRRDAADRYRELFAAAESTDLAPFEPEWSRAVYHLYVIRSTSREQLMQHLSNEGIGSGIHYPVPLHLQDAYKDLGYREGDFPVAEMLGREVVSLPMFPQLNAEQQARVVDAVMSFVRKGTEKARFAVA